MKQLNPFELLATKMINYVKNNKGCTDIMVKDEVLTLYKNTA
jgi:hypothetical protein